MASRIAHKEDDIQRAAVEHIEARGVAGLVFFHVPNSSKMGGKRTASGVPLEAIRLKRLGFRKGVSDLVFFHSGRFYVLELKAPGNHATREQVAFLNDCSRAGAHIAVATGLNETIRQLESWGLVRGRAI